MESAAEALEFERAARLRDDLGALRRAMERQAVVLGDGTDADVVAFAEDELEAAVQVFHVRGGRVRGQRGWVIDKVEPTETPRRWSSGSSPSSTASRRRSPSRRTTRASPCRGRSSSPSCPRTSTRSPSGSATLRGSRVQLRVPQRGDKRALAETVARNAAEAFAQHKLRRAGDLTARSAALQEIQDALGLRQRAAAHRVHRRLARAGHATSSPRWSCSRTAWRASRTTGASRSAAGADGDDVAAIAEVVRRRFRRYLAETTGGTEAGGNGRGGAADSGDIDASATPRRHGRASTRRPAGRAGSPTRRTCWSSTAARRRSRRPRTCWPSSASPTSRSAGWPSAWRRSGCRPSRTRSSSRAPARGCTCCSGSGTRRTGSPSPTTASVAPSG